MAGFFVFKDMAWSFEQFTPELQDEIAIKLAEGHGLNTIVISGEGKYPPESSIRRWLVTYPDSEWAAKYACARAVQADLHADEIIDIADTEPDCDRARIRIDARKWHAGRTRPRKWGDKLGIGGADDLPPVKTEDVTDPEIIARKMAFLMARIAKDKENG